MNIYNTYGSRHAMATILKFKDPRSDDEAQERYELIESRGDRVFVKLLFSGMQIEPTFVYLREELCEADRC